ncbi:hypothetical protein COCOR_03774 [Corallococcus coralloides DSM 2259]|uniref:Uncharacterized protein n=1 Tax=Corallococcus coralloides (strain ATCC 25202 / DSM 2259 / NBRC 100086 / M2) TaxID=1144275 RepID=H8MR08_CORCM|nr:hypothetical protein [Corallococcus coralloides]AFE05428.1 hypothetical protein COCOR_03774 [Corallococcus coralloides DSM 2259]
MTEPAEPQGLPVPQHVHNAQLQLSAALEKASGAPVDLTKAPWADVEKSVIQLLGGRFDPNNPNHQGAALGLAGGFALRLISEHQAFWFPNRDSPEGASLGFPEAIIMLSPFGAVMDALAQGKLTRLDDLAADIRRSLGQVKFGTNPAQALGGGQPQRLGPQEYQRLFDPGFLQFIVVDPAKVKQALEAKTDALARDVRDALGRTQPPLPPEARQQFEGQIVTSLQRMEQGKSLADQAERAPRLAELLTHLVATVGGTGSAPEEFWHDVVLPLLFIGAPASFPPLDDDELEAFKQGADPLALFVDVVPHSHRAPDEGLLGAFEMSEIGLVHPAFQKVGALRLIRINPERLKPMLEKYDPNATMDAVQRFTAHVSQAAGKPAAESPQGKEMLQAALTLLADLKRSVSVGGDVCLRRLTEAEAASEQALAIVRRALQSPRIILT